MTSQKTIKDQFVLKGVGLQTGRPVSMTLKSAPVDSGINFIRTDLPNRPLANINSAALNASGAPERRTTLAVGPMQIQTIEHFMAALSGLSIDNISVELDSDELPGMDGSAKDFVAAIRKAGITEQAGSKKVLEIKEPVWCREGDSIIAAFPDNNFKVSYTLSYPSPAIGTQYLSLVLTEKVFESEIAPARTFCLEEEAIALIKRGLGKGANYDNTLVMGGSGPVKTALRFPDEPVRHKILDLVGDLYLLGMPLKGHIVAIKSGHKLNMELVKKLKKGA